jgi:hypothetical protein
MFNKGLNSRQTNLENLKKEININDASKITSLYHKNRWEFNSIASNDSAFYEANDVNFKLFRNQNKFNDLNELDEKDVRTKQSELM